MAKSKVTCDNPDCQKVFERDNREINRSKRVGRKQYCCRSCYGNSWGNVGFANLPKEVVKRNQDRIKKFSGNQRDEHTPFRFFIKVANNSNRKKEVDITLQYLKKLWDDQKGICPITGWKMELPINVSGWKGKVSMKRASIDRIDNDKGYVKGNVRFVSFIANIARNRFSDKDLVAFCKAVAMNNP